MSVKEIEEEDSATILGLNMFKQISAGELNMPGPVFVIPKGIYVMSL